jgi:hypothetical protein
VFVEIVSIDYGVEEMIMIIDRVIDMEILVVVAPAIIYG